MNPKIQASSARHGFTLTELLAALAIVIVLAALAIGAGRRILDDSRAMSCGANLRRLAQAGLAYAADNRGSLPDRGRWVYASGAGSLLPYLGLPESTEIGAWDKVPGYAKAMTCPAVLASAEYCPATGLRSYSINQYATSSDTSSTSQIQEWENNVLSRGVPLKVGSIARPSQQVFFMDGPLLASGDVRYSTFQAPSRLASVTEGGSESWCTFYPHRDRINVVFLDGHGEVISRERAEKEELIGPTNSSPSPRTNPFWGAAK